jgi:putative transcriptional regulator
VKTKITQYRKELGLTQQDLAELVDVTRQTIISLEQGRYNPSLQLAYKITKTLNKKHVEDIFEIEEKD